MAIPAWAVSQCDGGHGSAVGCARLLLPSAAERRNLFGWVDTGLGGFLKAAGYSEAVYMAEWGKHKVPTLRNVDLRPTKHFIKAYAHNGYFKSLEEIVHFYNTRDISGAGWPLPEVATNINRIEMGNLGPVSYTHL